MTSNIQLPWFRQPWFWLVMSPLLLVIVACSVFIVIAVRYQDDRVVGDYYKEGLLVNERMDALRLARDLGLSAIVRFDRVTGELRVDLNQAGADQPGAPRSAGEEFPAELTLYLQHPSRQELDRRFAVKRTTGSTYVADLDRPLVSRWYITLLPPATAANQWRMQGEINLSSPAGDLLSP